MLEKDNNKIIGRILKIKCIQPTFEEVRLHQKKTNMATGGSNKGTKPKQKNNNNICLSCEEMVRNGSKALECEVCDSWFHIKCENIPEKFYEFLNDDDAGQQFHWTCNSCKRGYGKIFKCLQQLGVNQTELDTKQKEMEIELMELRESAERDRKEKKKN